MKGVKFIGLWCLVFIICVILRLPHFLSEKMFIDIDEATIGIMAKDVLAGKPLPYYFYFQNYGFSTIETLVTAGFIKIFGAGIWALKLAGIFMYSLAGTFIMLFLIEKNTKPLICICALIIIAAYPPWYIWGSLMRGGYLTSLVCTTGIFYITQKYTSDYLRVVITGVLFYLAYESHVVIFLSVFPLLVFWLFSGKNRMLKGVLFSIVFLVPLITGRLMYVSEYLGSIRIEFSFEKIANSFDLMSNFFLEAFTGFYTYDVLIQIPNYWSLLSILMIVLVFALLLMTILKRGIQIKVIALLTVGGVMSAIVSMLGESFSPRYLLGFFTALLLMIVVSINVYQTNYGKWMTILLTVITFIGITVGSKIRRHWTDTSGNEMALMSELYKEVKSKKIKGLYSIDKTFVWDYLYGDEIPSTNICGFDRSPQFLKHLRKLEKEGAKIGLFGNAGFQNEIIEEEYFENSSYVSNKYFLIENVNDSILLKARNRYCVVY